MRAMFNPKSNLTNFPDHINDNKEHYPLGIYLFLSWASLKPFGIKEYPV